MKIMKILVALLAVLMLTSVAHAADGVDLDWIKINGDEVDADDNIRVDLTEDIDIRVKLQATQNEDDIEVSARLVGYEYNDIDGRIYDVTRPFDMDANDTETVDLELSIPVRAEKDEYEIRVEVQNRRTDFIDESFTIRVKGPRSAIRIRDVIFSPRSEIIAGRLLVTQVRLENIGERDLDDVTVTASIPELNIVDQKFLDEELDGSTVGDGDSDVTEDLLLRIPTCAEAGVYDVDIIVEFDEFDTVSSSEQIYVLASESCAQNQVTQPTPVERTVITPPPSQDIMAGQSGSFPVIITNAGTAAEAYTVSVNGVAGWARADVTDSAPIVQPGETKTVYVYVSVNDDASAGQKVFSVSIGKDGTARDIPLTANVVADEKSGFGGLRNGLLIGVIILIVLFIILGLIIGLNKMRDDDDDDDMKGQAYY